MRRIAAVAVLASLLVAPLAQAQDVLPPDGELALQDWPSSIDPGASANVSLSITYNCEKVPAGQEVRTWINRSTPWWAQTVGPQTINLTQDTVSCQGNQSVATRLVDYTVLATEDAPAQVPGNVTFNVTITYPDGDFENETSASTEPTFAPAIQVTVDPKRSQAIDGRTARHNITIVNQGNGPIRAQITSVETPRRVEITLPDAARIEAARNGSQPSWTGEIKATGRLPQDVNFKNYSASFELTTRHADNLSLNGTGRDIELTFFVRRSQEEIEEQNSLPGFGPAVVAVAAVLSAAGKRKLL